MIYSILPRFLLNWFKSKEPIGSEDIINARVYAVQLFSMAKALEQFPKGTMVNRNLNIVLHPLACAKCGMRRQEKNHELCFKCITALKETVLPAEDKDLK